jgi:Flp pilus assembly protein TadD
MFGGSQTLSQREESRNRPHQRMEGETKDPKTIFQQGTTALANGQLKAAEQAFRQVIQINPRSAAALGNLGVVFMRQYQWGISAAGVSQG